MDDQAMATARFSVLRTLRSLRPKLLFLNLLQSERRDGSSPRRKNYRFKISQRGELNFAIYGCSTSQRATFICIP
jgi:hypothetical protein